LNALKEEKTRRLTEDRLAYFKPYAKQLAFFTAGASVRERLLMAANQSGKTLASAIEVACHASGRYPNWWLGRRFAKATDGWVAGESNEVVRDSIQKLLLGKTGEHGTGTIPKDAIVDVITARGIADLVDIIRVAHASGGISTITLKSYSAGREKFQGSTLDYVALEEEAPIEIYSEALTRTNATRGLVWSTFTPLQGVSEVVRRFLYEKSDDRELVTMTLDDCDHYDEKQKEQIAESYGEHEREARTKGIPTMGSGRIFPIAQDRIACDHRDIPAHWPRIGGMDFGWTHNFAACELAWDRDHDIVYLIRAFRQKESTPIMHAATLRHWGNLRWAWPRDGRRQTLEGAGVPLMEQYRDQGLDMLWEHAQFEDKGVSVEAGLIAWLDRMKTGRFKVFRELNDFWDEFNLYHRRDGKVFAENDDLLCAVRYALMMLRFARTEASRNSFNRAQIVYPPGYFQTRHA
jgi:phage terminase large subunit-like protein